MSVNVFKLNSAVNVYLEGDIDEFASRRLREDIDNVINGMNGGTLVLNFKNVSFLDSTGLGFVLSRFKNAQKRGVSLCLEDVPPQADKVFVASGVYKFVPKIN